RPWPSACPAWSVVTNLVMISDTVVLALARVETLGPVLPTGFHISFIPDEPDRPAGGRLLQELLPRADQVHPVLLQHDGVRAFRQQHEPAIRRARQPGEDLLGHVGWRVLVSFAQAQERRHSAVCR